MQARTAGTENTGNTEDIGNTAAHNADVFKRTCRPYLVRLSIVYALVMALVSVVTLSFLFPQLAFSQWLLSLFIESGAVVRRMSVHYGLFFSIGVNMLGVYTAGINGSGVIAFGMNAAGVVAIGLNAFGLIAIGGNAVGVVAIGYNAFGLYALSYNSRGKAKYLLAPHRQDAKALALFQRCFPKLAEARFIAETG